MYKKILVPLDGSALAEQILPYVRLFSTVGNVPVELLWVNDVIAITHWPWRSGQEYLRQVRAKYLSSHQEISSLEAEGSAAEAIVVRAESEPDTLIAMATHGMSGLSRWLIGSVAGKVAQSAKNPLLLVRPAENVDPTAPITINTIFVPLDGSALAEKALRYAVPLARKLKLNAQLLRVYSLPREAFIVADGVIAQGPEQFRDVVRQEAENYLVGKVDTLRAEGLHNVVGTALEGDAANEIIDIAANTASDLIVMSTHGRSGMGRWLLGSVAQKVVQHSRTPVLLIRAGSSA